jgi:hypothetical protein
MHSSCVDYLISFLLLPFSYLSSNISISCLVIVVLFLLLNWLWVCSNCTWLFTFVVIVSTKHIFSLFHIEICWFLSLVVGLCLLFVVYWLSVSSLLLFLLYYNRRYITPLVFCYTNWTDENRQRDDENLNEYKLNTSVQISICEWEKERKTKLKTQTRTNARTHTFTTVLERASKYTKQTITSTLILVSISFRCNAFWAAISLDLTT